MGIQYDNSDRQKRLAYHEIAHASHYRQVGKNYWLGLVEAEIFANGHGTAASNDAGLIALCESWAEHIGIDFTLRTYPTDPIILRNAPIVGDWDLYQEQIKNEIDNHIPIGLYHDLSDNVGDAVNSCDEPRLNAAGTALIWGPCNPIDDNVSGITNRQMFQQLLTNVISPQDFISRINNIVIPNTSNTIQDVNDLFISY